MTLHKNLSGLSAALLVGSLTGCASQKPAQKSEAAPMAAAPAPAAAPTTAPAVAAPVATPDAPFRSVKPAVAAQAAPFEAPVPTERTLSNGARLLVVENHAVPLVSIDVLIETGVDGEPAGKGGLAKFVAATLDEGTKSRSSLELAAALEDLAINLFISAGQETTQLNFNSLKDTLPAGLDLLADILVNPAFRSADVERVRGLLQSDLDQKQSSPGLLARDELGRILYGAKHPWGLPSGGTPATLRGITIADLTKFHDLYFRPTNAIISVSGDVTADEIAKLLEEKLAGWKKRPRVAVKLPAVKPLKKRVVVLVDKPGASQSQVWTFGPAVPANSPDAVALRVANHIVGGPFARLDLNIREDKGYSYGVRGSVALLRAHGYWLASGGVKADVTAESLVEFEKELSGFHSGQLKAGELENAKLAIVRSLPSSLERNDSVASAMALLAFNGQPLDYYKTLAARVAKVDAQEVARVAAKYDRPETWSIVIVGPRSASEEKLKAMKLGDIEVKSTSATAGIEAAGGRTSSTTAPAAVPSTKSPAK